VSGHDVGTGCPFGISIRKVDPDEGTGPSGGIGPTGEPVGVD
jgi:hypothetical protein